MSSDKMVVPFGDRAVLIACPAGVNPLAVADAARSLFGATASAVVPGAETVVVHLTGGPVGDPLAVGNAALAAASASAPTGRDVVLPVIYDGQDLADVADLLGMSVEEVVARHTGSLCTVAFLGFAPGFPYLTGLDPALTVPRLETPRTRVPAGSVGLAGGSTCVYPGVSPGGWRLIGRTETVLFDADADSPALLSPGDRVRFEAVRG